MKVHATNPKRTDALMIHGKHYFQNSNWLVALTDFSAVLQQEPGLAEARWASGGSRHQPMVLRALETQNWATLAEQMRLNVQSLCCNYTITIPTEPIIIWRSCVNVASWAN